MVGSAQVSEPAELEHIELRPIGDAGAVVTDEQEVAARAIFAERGQRRAVALVGEAVYVAGRYLAMTSCMPRAWTGTVCRRTMLSFGTRPVPILLRVQMSCINPRPNDVESRLFEDLVQPFLDHLQDDICSANHEGRENKIYVTVAKDSVLKIAGRSFAIAAVEPSDGVGAIGDSTLIYVRTEKTPVLERISALPYRDTLPAAYSFDLFQDMLKPYFSSKPLQTYKVGDDFSCNGVRCCVMAIQPLRPGGGRVGSSTLIFCEGTPLAPRRATPADVVQMLDDDLRQEMEALPQDLQQVFLNTVANQLHAVDARDAQEGNLNQGRGLSKLQIRQHTKAVTWEGAAITSGASGGDEPQCMVCLAGFELGESLLRLPCNHLFHDSCVGEWLTRSAHCPLCKAPVGGGTSGRSGGRSSRGGRQSNRGRGSSASVRTAPVATSATSGGASATLTTAAGALRDTASHPRAGGGVAVSQTQALSDSVGQAAALASVHAATADTDIPSRLDSTSSII
eukprot:TRINITY_DN51419_c0_g1_i1.p1 TRINITY_DN51419_c0_g1~~TRINITY_DN51419_c0_g1_i1.p1  ORF type:complete len:509 (-),score=77.63 TRINITY_DN51419_c0_g1_i1:104-1630(-)